MNLNKTLKKLLNNQTLMVLAGIVVVAALYLPRISMPMSGMENAVKHPVPLIMLQWHRVKQ